MLGSATQDMSDSQKSCSCCVVMQSSSYLYWRPVASGGFAFFHSGAIVNQKYNGVETPIGGDDNNFMTGHISGAHLNTFLTIAFAACRHFPRAQVPAYVAAQVSAPICALLALKGVFHPFMSGSVTVPSINYGQAFALEFLITSNPFFIVTTVATDTRAAGELAGLAVAATVRLNIPVAGPSSGVSMNPVRTLGPAVAAGNYKALWIYLIAPMLGAMFGAGTYSLVKLREEETEAPRQVRTQNLKSMQAF